MPNNNDNKKEKEEIEEEEEEGEKKTTVHVLKQFQGFQEGFFLIISTQVTTYYRK